MKSEGLSFVSISRFRLWAAVFLSLLLASCGSHQGGSEGPVKTGAVSFTVEWEPPPEGYVFSGAKSLSNAPRVYSYEIDPCVDYDVDKVRLEVFSPNAVNPIAGNTFDCYTPGVGRQGTVNGVPPGDNLELHLSASIKGSTNNVWYGKYPTPFNLSAGDQIVLPEKITMTYDPNVGGDTEPPTVTSTTPGNNETNVPNNSTIQVQFSEGMARSTVLDNESIMVVDNTGSRLPCVNCITYNDLDNVATFTPATPLAFGNTHTVTIDNNIVTDKAGHWMESPFEWSFTAHNKGEFLGEFLIASNLPKSLGFSQVSMDGSGNAIVSWSLLEETGGGTFPLTHWAKWYKASDGNWSAPKLISHLEGNPTYLNQVMDDSGNAWLTWSQNYDGSARTSNSCCIWGRRFWLLDDVWTSPQLIYSVNDGDKNLDRPDVAMDANGNAIIAWIESVYNVLDGGYNYSVYSKKYSATSQSWQDENTPLSSANQSHTYDSLFIDMNSRGDAVAVWVDRDINTNGETIWANLYFADNNAWMTAFPISATYIGGQYPSKPRVAMSEGEGTGNAIVVWHQYDGGRANIYAKRYRASIGSWGGPWLLDANDTGDAILPKVAYDDSGSAVVIWEERPGARWNIWANHFLYGDFTWTGPINIGTSIGFITGSGGSYHVAMDGSGNAVAMWKYEDFNQEIIYANRYTAATLSWSGPIQIENPRGITSVPPYVHGTVAMDRDGKALAVWGVDAYMVGGTEVWGNMTD